MVRATRREPRAVENINQFYSNLRHLRKLIIFFGGPPLGDSFLLHALAQFFFLSGQLSPEMRHCRSCSKLVADGDGDSHMTKAAELHTEIVGWRGSRSAHGKWGVGAWRGRILA
jgi:hypothetical protein